MAEIIAKLIIKKTDAVGAIPLPSFLDYGELALNFRDGKLYYKNHLDVIATIGGTEEDPDVAKQNIDNVFTGINTFYETVTFGAGVSMNVVSLTPGDVSWDCSLGNLANLTLTEDSLLENLINTSPGTYVLRVTQDATGGWALDFDSAYKTPSGDEFTINTNPFGVSIITILNMGDSNLYLIGQPNFITISGNVSGIPNLIQLTGVTSAESWMNEVFTRVPDVNSSPAWEYLFSDTQKAVISDRDNDGIYYIVVWIKPVDEGDPWEVDLTAFSLAGDNPIGTYTTLIGATGTAITTAPTSIAVYNLFVNTSLPQVGAVGTEVEFFPLIAGYVWEGDVDVIPDGFVWRSVNPFYPTLNRTHIYLGLKESGNYAIGYTTDLSDVGGDLTELATIGVTPGPLGVYTSVDAAPADYVVTITTA